MCWCALDCIVLVLESRILLVNIVLKKNFSLKFAEIYEIKSSSASKAKGL